MKKTILAALAAGFVAVSALLPTVAAAQEALLPFVLASKGSGSVDAAVADVRAKATAAGLEIAGEYRPHGQAAIILVTNDAMKTAAAANEYGAYGIAQRVAVTDVNGEIQVSYTNPSYMGAGYRMEADMAPITALMTATFGAGESFGPAKGLTDKALRKFHYMFGMEYFDEPSELAEYDSHSEAVAAVEAALAAGKGGVTKVARIDVPGRDETYFAVALKGADDKAKYMDDAYIMSEVDFKPLRSTAHLPYEMVVSGDTVYALYARFRIAVNFPDLAMMGKNSFMNIMDSPEAIRKALVLGAGGALKKKKNAWD